MTTELRDYLISESHLDEFVAAWRQGVVPLREQHGYRIDGAWLIREERRFVWLLSLGVPQSEWDARNEAYYADPARAALDPDPAQWVDQAENRFVELVIPEAGGSRD
ncbi:MAG: NIPSNAP family containing protein [Chloroflexota bacterium]|nr:NIPSNAP family containing protein [Chloroflexota bacterium]